MPFCRMYLWHATPLQYLTLYQPPHACTMHDRYVWLNTHICGAVLALRMCVVADVVKYSWGAAWRGVAKIIVAQRELNSLPP